VWKRNLEGRTLTFRLAGINNQNFIMQDDQTRSYWQQVSGKAISGPLKGKQLELVPVDELTFALWQKESPGATILAPTTQEAKYDPADWEQEMQKVPTVTAPNGPLPNRELILGISHNGEDKAYPFARLKEQKVIQDLLGRDPIAIVLGPDGKSVRAFVARSPQSGQVAEFFTKTDGPWALIDSVDGQEWDFRGCRQSDANSCLKQLYVLHDYWFDWRTYHPQTAVYQH
jgi:hypothetical protein